MKRIVALLLCTALMAALCACGGGTGLAAIQKKGKLTVATSPDFPPFESLEGGKIVGIEVEIVEQAARKLGVTADFQQMDFESVLPGVQAGKFDMGMSGITITEERQKNALFTQPYFMASQAIVVLTDSPITCKADLTGKTISVQTGTTAEEYCMENGYKVQAFQANNDASSALITGKVDAWVVDNEVAVALTAQLGGQAKVLDEAMTQEPYAFAFAKGSDELVKAFDGALGELMQDGTVEAIFEKYGVPYVAP